MMKTNNNYKHEIVATWNKGEDEIIIFNTNFDEIISVCALKLKVKMWKYSPYFIPSKSISLPLEFLGFD